MSKDDGKDVGDEHGSPSAPSRPIVKAWAKPTPTTSIAGQREHVLTDLGMLRDGIGQTQRGHVHVSVGLTVGWRGDQSGQEAGGPGPTEATRCG